MSEPEPRAEPAPEGSTCAAHEQRPARVTCPRCGDYCCIACWHAAQMRCHACWSEGVSFALLTTLPLALLTGIIPQVGLILSLVIWGLPSQPGETSQLFAEVASLLPLMLLLWSMTATARMSGVGPFAAMVVTLVPFVLLFLVEPLLIDLVRPLLPDLGSAQSAMVNGSPSTV